MADIDPYHLWLQIPAGEQPPNHYRLLGLVLFEEDPNVIDNAAEQRLFHLKNAQNGPHGSVAQRIMNEVSKARVTLLNQASKRIYDEQLKQALNPITPGVTISAKPNSKHAAAMKGKYPAVLYGGIGGILVLILSLGFFLSGKGDRDEIDDPNANRKTASNNEKLSESSKRQVGQNKSPTTRSKPDSSQDKTGKPNSTESNRKKKQAETVVTKTKRIDNSSSPTRPKPKTSPQKSKNSDRDDRIDLNTLYANTFSQESEKQLAVGKPIDLLPLLKLPENLKQGIVRKENNRLVMESTSSVNHLDFPLILPAHFDLSATVTRLPLVPGTNKHDDGMGFGIHVANRPCLFAIDHFPLNGYLTGLRQFFKPKTPRPAMVKGRVLDFNKPTKIHLHVRPTGVRMQADGRLVYQYKGDPSSLRPVPHLAPGVRNLFQLRLMSWKTRFVIENLRLTPRGPAAEDEQWLAKSTVNESEKLGRPVNLMPKFRPSHVIGKPVSKDRFGIKVGPKKFAGFEIPMNVADEYDLRMKVTTEGPNGVVVCLPMGERQPFLVINQFRRRSPIPYRTTLETVNGRYMDMAIHLGLFAEKLFEDKKDTVLDIQVRFDSVRLFVDGKFTYGWSGTREQLALPTWRDFPPVSPDNVKLRVICLDSPFLIKQFTYRPVVESQRLPHEFDRLVDKVQSINPALAEFWKRHAIDAKSGGQASIDQDSSKRSLPGDHPDANAMNDSNRLQLGLLGKKEQAELDQARSTIAEACQSLNEKKFDDAFSTIRTAEKQLTLKEAKLAIEGIKKVADDYKSFWQKIPARCTLLKPTQQLVFTDSAAVVVSASREQLQLRTGGVLKSYPTSELPIGIAMKIFDVTAGKKDAEFMRTRGSVFYLASVTDPKYRTKAIHFWMNAEKAGESIDSLLMLVSKNGKK